MRCASPPERVRVCRSSVRYPSPTSTRKPTRESSSLRMLSAMPRSCSLSGGSGQSAPVRPSRMARSQGISRPSGSAETSAIVRPPTRTRSASARSLAPPQTGQSCALWYWRMKTRMYCLYRFSSSSSKNW